MSISDRHHYIPEFLSKGFTEPTSNRVEVYDIETGRFWKNPASPKQIFFRYGRNTFDVNNTGPADALESLFAIADNEAAGILAKAIKNTTDQISDEDIMELAKFAGILYWRLPITDAKNKHYVESNPSAKLNFQLVDPLTGEQARKETYEKIQSDPAFIEYYRIARPLRDMLAAADYLNPKEWSLVQMPKPASALISDNPIIHLHGGLSNIFVDFWIVPMGHNRILTRLPQRITNVSVEDMLDIDILVFLQATRYVCSSDKNHLSKIAELASPFRENNRIIESHRLRLFRRLFSQAS